MGRIVALDIGLVRIGLAVSDTQKIIATPLPFVMASYLPEKTVERLLSSLKSYFPLDVVVVGLPLHLSGRESKMSTEVRQLVPFIEAGLSAPVVFFDERFTSCEAEALLKTHDVSRKKRKDHVDSLAAALMLKSYLSKHFPCS